MKKSFLEIEREQLIKDRELVLDQFIAVSEQLRTTIQEDLKIPLERRRLALAAKLKELERKIEALGPSPIGAETKGSGGQTEPGQFFGQGNRWAVLVGIGCYEDSSNYWELPVCPNDAKSIRDKLFESGYGTDRVHLLTDDEAQAPTRSRIRATLKAVADATEPDDLFLFYFSGHGDASDGKNYLVTCDSFRNDLAESAIALFQVREIMQTAQARAKVIIVDACKSGLLFKGPRTMPPEFIRAAYERAKGWAAIASCEQEQLSYVLDDAKNSVFTYFLLEALGGEADFHEKGFVSVQDAHNYVLKCVKVWASQHKVSQTPTLHSETAGDIILTKYALG